MKFIVKVPSPEVSEAIQILAFHYGYKWNFLDSVQNVRNTDERYLVFNQQKLSEIGYTNSDEWVTEQRKETYALYQHFDIEGIIKCMKTKERVWVFGQYEGKFVNNQFIVGCFKVNLNTIKDIYEESIKIAKEN